MLVKEKTKRFFVWKTQWVSMALGQSKIQMSGKIVGETRISGHWDVFQVFMA